MVEKNKSEVKSNPKKSNGNFLRNFLLIFGLTMVAIVAVTKYNPKLLDNFLKRKFSPIEQSSSIEESTLAGQNNIEQGNNIEPGNKPKQPILQDILSAIPQQLSLPSFAPDKNEAEDEGAEDVDSGEQHPYEVELEKEQLLQQDAQPIKSQVQLMSDLNNYRLFLANADRLITKFRQDEEFYDELDVFNSITHPERIKNIIILLEDYNRVLSNPECNCSDRLVKFFSSKPLNKFIKVTKISKASKEQKALKDGINEELALLIDYIYSAELQKSFIK